MKRALLGLDLSTRAAAAVAVPLDWDGDFGRVSWEVFGIPLKKDASDFERALRTERIATGIVRFARAHHVKEAWIEGYAFNQKKAAHTLGEVGGVVRVELVRAGIAISTANMSSSRVLLLGKLPPRGSDVSAKQESARVLAAAGAPTEWIEQEGLDLVDGYVAVNLGLSIAGGFFYAQPAPLKAKRGRAA